MGEKGREGGKKRDREPGTKLGHVKKYADHQHLHLIWCWVCNPKHLAMPKRYKAPEQLVLGGSCIKALGRVSNQGQTNQFINRVNMLPRKDQQMMVQKICRQLVCARPPPGLHQLTPAAPWRRRRCQTS